MAKKELSFLENPEMYRNGDLTVLVVGAGHVGLTHACLYAESGAKVLMSDADNDILDHISRGESPFYEPMIGELLKNRVGGNFFIAKSLPEAVVESDVVSVSVGTPLNALDEPDIDAVFRVCVKISEHARDGTLLLITSTIPVGTTSRLKEGLLKRGVAVGEKLGLSYCPERMVTGQGIKTAREFPRIVSGTDHRSVKAAEHFFQIIGVKTIVVSMPEVAEMSKLLCNAYRAANIALANEYALVCSAYGLDWPEVFSAANTSPLVKIMRPGVMGGSCLTKDPDFLIYGALQEGIILGVSTAARQLNRRMPSYVVKLVMESLERASRQVSKSKIAILGLAFKGETSDTRETPVFEIISLLNAMGCSEICVYDPYVLTEDIASTGLRFDLVRNMEDAASGASCLIIATEHRQIANANLSELCRLTLQPPIVIDAKGTITTRFDNFIQGGIGLPLKELSPPHQQSRLAE